MTAPEGIGVGETARAAERRGIAAVVRDPTVIVTFTLALTSVFEFLEHNWVHGTFLCVVGLVLGWDAVGDRPVRAAVGASRTEAYPWSNPDPRTTAGVVFGCFVYALLAGSFARFSWPSTVAVVLPGAIAMAIAWEASSRPAPLTPKLHLSGAAAWTSVFIALGLWELSALLLQPSLTTDSWAHPTISVLTDPILAHHPGRTIVLTLWLAAGWWLVQR
jgi:hypothetical protein